MSNTILEVKNLTVSIKATQRRILENINLQLNEGDVLAIDGKNGCGKSSLIRIIFGNTSDYIIESGEIFYYPFSSKNILSLTTNELNDFRRSIAFVKQKDNYDGLNKVTILDLIEDAISDIPNKNLNEYIEKFDKYFEGKNDITLKSIPGKLSGGEQRLVSIFLGLICREKSSLMIVDEPLNNLDFENVMMISNVLNQAKIDTPNSAMLLVTHCKIITCVTRQRKIINGQLEENDSQYECHHCLGEPDCNLFYKLNKK